MVFMARQTCPTFRGSWGRTSTTRKPSRDVRIPGTILGANKIVVNPALPADTLCGIPPFARIAGAAGPAVEREARRLEKIGEQFDKSDFPCIILASFTGKKGI
jgi:hypothetical protein